MRAVRRPGSGSNAIVKSSAKVTAKPIDLDKLIDIATALIGRTLLTKHIYAMSSNTFYTCL